MTAAVSVLPVGTIVVSGGCRGVDTWAAEAARVRGLTVVEHLPDLSKVNSRGHAARKFYDRNQVVVDDCDRIVAFVAPDRKGGTEDTIKRAIAAGKPVTIM